MKPSWLATLTAQIFLVGLLAADQTTPVADTIVNGVPCAVPNTCGSECPQFQRALPFTGTFYIAVGANGANSCVGGKYRLIVTKPGGSGAPALVADDVP